ncbi:chymotrypsin-1-like [Anopheles marshallii]|uniref:chymotrypsin-1-like n=1 Tax=Anopheles marshallii TaxID=1521116 RepID=UPI00237A2E34|nr:chymotrypsin-1-like [Anopheles marshallii]
MVNFTSTVVLVIVVIAIFTTSEVYSIVGGHTSLPGAAPYIVAIKTTTASTFVCAGVLVKSTWILTTAQCVTDKAATELNILTGSHRLLTNKKMYSISNIQRHPSYNATSGASNLALLQLSEAVSLSKRVEIIDLNDASTPTDTPVVFYGWGTLSYGSPGYSNILQTLYRRTLSLSDCRTRNGMSYLSDGNICAISQPGQAACTMDESGPLVRIDSPKLVGLFHYGPQCNGRSPDVFVDVFTEKAWIDSVAI